MEEMPSRGHSYAGIGIHNRATVHLGDRITNTYQGKLLPDSQLLLLNICSLRRRRAKTIQLVAFEL
jgi:hypothetical protein